MQLRGIGKAFGGLHALDDIDLDLQEGAFLGLIGPNGAGKTTMLNVMSGYLPPSSGQIMFQGSDVTSWPSWRRSRIGITRTFQSNRLLPGRSVADHLRLALQAAENPGVAACARRAFVPADRRRAIMEALETIGMADLADEQADELSHGHQRLLGILMTVTACPVRPAVLLLDEPVTGMNDVEVAFAIDLMRSLQRDGFTLVLVEHNMRAVMSAVDQVLVLDVGIRLAQGTPQEVAEDPRVIEAYLGVPDEGA